jgi:hypothetical protein
VHKFYLVGAVVCLVDALILLWVYESVAGFWLGFFGFTLCVLLAPIIKRVK